MTSSPTPSLVRADQRYSCSLNAVVRPGGAAGSTADGAEPVVLGRTAGEGDGTTKATVVDVSRGGLGVSTPIFFPRGARVEVSIALPGGAPGTVVGRVQRVDMRDRNPTYYLGLALVSPQDSVPVLESIMSDLRKGSAEVRR